MSKFITQDGTVIEYGKSRPVTTDDINHVVFLRAFERSWARFRAIKRRALLLQRLKKRVTRAAAA